MLGDNVGSADGLKLGVLLGDDDGSARGDLLGAGDGSTDGSELDDGLGSIDIDAKSVRNNRSKNAISSSCTDWLSTPSTIFDAVVNHRIIKALP